jgi:CheY-like chemotaxis protein
VLAFTADIVPETKEKINKVGFDDILSKPFTKNELLEKIKIHCLNPK